MDSGPPAAVQQVYEYLVGPNYADPRVASWPLIDPTLPIVISCIYLLGIPVGMRLMRDREPFKLKTFSMLHNGVLFGLSLWMATETVLACYALYGWTWPKWCNAVEPWRSGPGGSLGFSVFGARLARVLYVHYVSKAYEFVDTAIMVLKKNNRQVSFLHVYHHATTFFPVWWLVVKYGPGGEAWYCCFLNSLVHVFMYGYYFAASLGLRVGAVKMLITQLQMVQFVTFIAQSVYMLFITDCYRPRIQPWLLLVQATIFLALFAHFFVGSYLRKPAKGAKAN